MKKIIFIKFIFLLFLSINSFGESNEKYLEFKNTVVNAEPLKVPIVLYKGNNKVKLTLKDVNIIKEEGYKPKENNFTLLWDGNLHTLEINIYTAFSWYRLVKKYRYTNDKSIIFDCSKEPGIVDAIFNQKEVIITLNIDGNSALNFRD